MTTLVCPECRHENEPERIYCHDCGARLDRSALAKAPVKQERPEETHRRLRTMFDPRRGKLRQTFFKVSKVILGAFVTAAVIQMLLPPDVPPRRNSVGLPPEINFDLEKASRAHGAPPLRYTAEQANAYIASVVKSKHAALSGFVQFERALLSFDENICGLTVERSVFGCSLYTAATYRIALQNGALVTATRSGSIGRLPVHPALMKPAGFLFRDVAAVLDRDRKSVAQMAAIEFHPQLVVITPQP
jgi:hypothetical protein